MRTHRPNSFAQALHIAVLAVRTHSAAIRATFPGESVIAVRAGRRDREGFLKITQEAEAAAVRALHEARQLSSPGQLPSRHNPPWQARKIRNGKGFQVYRRFFSGRTERLDTTFNTREAAEGHAGQLNQNFRTKR